MCQYITEDIVRHSHSIYRAFMRSCCNPKPGSRARPPQDSIAPPPAATDSPPEPPDALARQKIPSALKYHANNANKASTPRALMTGSPMVSAPCVQLTGSPAMMSAPRVLRTGSNQAPGVSSPRTPPPPLPPEAEPPDAARKNKRPPAKINKRIPSHLAFSARALPGGFRTPQQASALRRRS